MMRLYFLCNKKYSTKLDHQPTKTAIGFVALGFILSNGFFKEEK